jgi:peptidoglycan biosynthesis protein MviN/MurJ (putative lipid II flippase)
MSRSTPIREGWPSAGVFLAPVAWALNTQLNYALVPWVCHHGINIVPAIAVANALLALVGGFLSWRGLSTRAEGRRESPHGGRPHYLVAVLGMSMAALFAAVILLQGAAGLFLQGCER